MIIYTMCVDQERGGYMAISTEDPELKVICGGSEEEALGRLIQKCEGLTIDKVISIETSWK